MKKYTSVEEVAKFTIQSISDKTVESMVKNIA